MMTMEALYDKPVILTKEVDVPAKGIAHVNFELNKNERRYYYEEVISLITVTF